MNRRVHLQVFIEQVQKSYFTITVLQHVCLSFLVTLDTCVRANFSSGIKNICNCSQNQVSFVRFAYPNLTHLLLNCTSFGNFQKNVFFLKFDLQDFRIFADLLKMVRHLLFNLNKKLFVSNLNMSACYLWHCWRLKFIKELADEEKKCR